MAHNGDTEDHKDSSISNGSSVSGHGDAPAEAYSPKADTVWQLANKRSPQTTREMWFLNSPYPFRTWTACIIGFVVIGVVSAVVIQQFNGSIESKSAKHSLNEEQTHAENRQQYTHQGLHQEEQNNRVPPSNAQKPSQGEDVIKKSTSIDSDLDRLNSVQQRVIEISAGRKKRMLAGEDQYVVVFDAGSTGTRVHIYQFRLKDDSGVQLVNEVFKAQKPGLSDFDDDPLTGAASLQPLIEIAMAAVPESQRRSTPLLFKATAGFRLLDQEEADVLLGHIRERLQSTTSFSFDPQDVSVMGGTDEGVFGWITVNYLLDGDFNGTVAAHDLGGASVQLTFETNGQDDFPFDRLHHLNFFGQSILLYTHSYLGLGLKAARFSILRKDDSGWWMSSCLPVGYEGSLHYNDITYNTRGPESVSQAACVSQVMEFLSTFVFDPCEELTQSYLDIYLFSYFYDALVWAGAITSNVTETVISVKEYSTLTEKVCAARSPKRPFLCQDLTYITHLLGNKLLLNGNPLHVVSHISAGETSWALGAALVALADDSVD